jgi:hypothetical protein
MCYLKKLIKCRKTLLLAEERRYKEEIKREFDEIRKIHE